MIRIWEFQEIRDQDLGISISSSSSLLLLLRRFLTRSLRGRLLSQFQDMDGKPGDFTMAEGHGHPLVTKNELKVNYKWTINNYKRIMNELQVTTNEL